MNRRQRAGLIVVGIFVIGMLAFFFSQNPSSVPHTAKPTSNIGIIDLKGAASHHPEYGRLQELRRQINTLQAQLESMQQLEEPQLEQATADAEGLAQAAEDLHLQQSIILDTAARKEIQKKRLALRKEAAQEMTAAVEEVNAVYMPQIFNIQLKLENLRLDDAVRQKYEKDRESVYEQREAAIEERRQEIDAKYAAALEEYISAVHAQAAAQMDEQSSRQAEELAEQGEAIGRRNAEAAAAQQQKFSPLEAAASQQAIEAKEREAAALEERIRNDIAAKAMQVAVERGLEAVIAPSQHVNIFAVDITDFVIAQFNS